MTATTLLKKLEDGEEIKTPLNNSLLTLLQTTIDANYAKFIVNIEVSNGQMTLKRIGDFRKFLG